MTHCKWGRKSVFALIMGLITIFCLLGCSTPQPAKTRTEMASEPVSEFALGPGDIIDIKFFYIPELDESQTILSDGTISLQLIGKVKALGKTPAELRQELMKLYKKELRKPEITVIVRKQERNKVYVSGEVERPGSIEMPGRLTALEAIMEVGGGKRPTADMRNVLIIRRVDNIQYGCLVNLKDPLWGKEDQAFFLHPKDIVFVPPTKITQANDWVNQYINKLLPQTQFILLRPFGPGGGGTIGVSGSQQVF